MRLLLMDDDPLLREAWPPGLMRRLPHCDITTAHSPEDGLDHLEHESFDVVITDLLLSGMPRKELICRIRPLARRAPVILITGVPECPDELLLAHLVPIVRKPFEVATLAHTIVTAMANQMCPSDG